MDASGTGANGTWKAVEKTISKLILLGVLVALGWWLFAHLMSPNAPTLRSGPSPGLVDIATSIIRHPQIVVDEEVAIGASGAQARSFTLPSSRPVQIVAEGKTHADKGFSLYVMAPNQWDAFKSGHTFQHDPSFEGTKVRSFGHTETLPAGSWTVVVQNSENIFNTMVVRLRIVLDPS